MTRRRPPNLLALIADFQALTGSVTCPNTWNGWMRDDFDLIVNLRNLAIHPYIAFSIAQLSRVTRPVSNDIYPTWL